MEKKAFSTWGTTILRIKEIDNQDLKHYEMKEVSI